jgi:ferrous iron transport protein A
MMPLTFADSGKLLKIQKISGTDEIRQHLATLGFVTGEEIQVVNKNGGNMIVGVKGSRIALDKTLANRIYI